jgi:hypothetical protein
MTRTGNCTRSTATSFARKFCSFQPVVQFGWIPRTVKNCQYRKDILRDGKLNGIRFKTSQANNSCITTHQAKPLWLALDTFKSLINLVGKVFAQAPSFMLVPGNCLGEFHPGGRLKKDGPAHHQPKRCRISAWTCSKGMPEWGSFSNSASRRSSSAACSGVNSASTPPSPAQTFSAMSYCSSGGNRRICSKISDALMTLIYRSEVSVQAEFLPGSWPGPRLNPPATS